MSAIMEEEIKRSTARRKSAPVLEIIQGKATISEVNRQFDLTPSEIESSIKEGRRGMENTLWARPSLKGYASGMERQLKDLQEPYGKAMLELRARKNWSPSLVRTRPDDHDPTGTVGRRLRGIDDEVIPPVRHSLVQRVLPAKQNTTLREAETGRAAVRLLHGGGVAGHAALAETYCFSGMAQADTPGSEPAK